MYIEVYYELACSVEAVLLLLGSCSLSMQYSTAAAVYFERGLYPTNKQYM